MICHSYFSHTLYVFFIFTNTYQLFYYSCIFYIFCKGDNNYFILFFLNKAKQNHLVYLKPWAFEKENYDSTSDASLKN